jgi:outer membrane immunogenic protein
MSRLIVGTVVLLAMVAGAAAADFPIYSKTAALSWTGFYVGGNAGDAWGTSDVNFVFPPFNSGVPPLETEGSPRLKPNGFTGGIQTGYNFQAGRLVVGTEFDINYLGLSASRQTLTKTVPFGLDPFNFAESIGTNWLLTVRPRIGLAIDRWLLYVTGGLAVGNHTFSQTLTFISPTGLLDINSGTVAKVQAGWTAGFGLEYMITGNWSLKAEYLHVDLGQVGFDSTNTLVPTVTGDHDERLRIDIVRAGVNYKFDWYPPVTANY